MGSPITFSGFNQIDFNIVLNAVMQQESRPLQTLQAQQQTLQSTDSAYGELATQLSALEDAARALGSSTSGVSYAASVSDTSALTAATAIGAAEGRYDVVVQELARAQVTASASVAPDAGTTIVADGGSITIGGVAVTLTGPATLQDLAAAINAAGAPATATVVQTGAAAYRLVLTSRDTGTAGAFTIQSGLSGSTLTFADADGNGVAGDSPADNAVAATDASLVVNGIAVTSASNTLADAIPGVTLTLLQKDPAKTITVGLTRDADATAAKVQAFIDAYNALVKFANDQSTAAGKGTAGTLGRDALLRSLRGQLRSTLAGAHGTGTFTRLAEIGIGFTRTGELTLDRARLDDAVKTDAGAVASLFAAQDAGVFRGVDTLLTEYTRSGGVVPDARLRISQEISRLGQRIDDMQARLAIRRAALQREYAAADAVMARLNSQSGSLASIASSLSSSKV
jgi:flagellar hook-associated protein 2